MAHQILPARRNTPTVVTTVRPHQRDGRPVTTGLMRLPSRRTVLVGIAVVAAALIATSPRAYATQGGADSVPGGPHTLLADVVPAAETLDHSVPLAPARLATSLTPAVDAPAVPATHRDMLVGPGGLHARVTTYADCTATAPLDRGTAAIDLCVTGRAYFIGHNPGVFTPLLSMGPGSLIVWWDHSGTAHRLEVADVDLGTSARGADATPPAGVVAQFQTCEVADGSVIRVLDAIPA